MNTAMYLRKSRSEDTTDSVEQTLSRHKEILLAFAHQNHLCISRIYEEVYTGDSLYSRPEMLRLLSDVEHGEFDAILCMDIDRLGRGGMSEQGIILDTLKYSNTKIITPRKIYDLNNEMDEEYTEFETFLARRELKLIKRRLHRGIQKTIQDGGYIANAPYGYEKTVVHKQPTLKIIEQEAAFVRMMFDLYVNQGMGCTIIANTVNALGAKPRRSETFQRTSVKKILTNPVYIGKIVWNQKTHIRKGARGNEMHTTIYNPPESWTITDGIHPPIISEELFHAAQEILKERYHPPSFNGTVKNPLSGILRCKNCGGFLQRQLVRKGGEYLFCPRKGCMVSSQLPLVEEGVLRALRDHLAELDLNIKQPPQEPNDRYAAPLQAAESERKKIETQRSRLHDLLEQGIYTIDTFLSRQAQLVQKQADLQRTIQTLVEKQQSHRHPDYRAMHRNIRHVLDTYPNSDAAQRNFLLKSVVQSGVYWKEKGSPPNGFRVELTLKLRTDRGEPKRMRRRRAWRRCRPLP